MPVGNYAALVAFGNGGMFGTGIGLGSAKLGHLPLPHTDFIFSVIGEELGFVGVFTVVIVFAFLIIKSIKIGREAMAQDRLFYRIACARNRSIYAYRL